MAVVLPNGFETLIFQHVPKTAGSTMHPIIGRCFRRKDTLSVFGAGFDSESVRKLIELADEKKCRLRLIKGHLPFGLHQYLPQRTAYVTVLRHPVGRVQSLYRYIVNNPVNPLHEAVVRAGSLEAWIRSGISPGANNGQVRWLTGEVRAVPFGETSTALLDAARRNVATHFLHVGLTEQFDRSLLLLWKRLGLRGWPVYARRNVARRDEATSSSTPNESRAIEEFNELDLILYEEARERLDRDWSGWTEADAALKTFRRLNGVFQWLYRPRR